MALWISLLFLNYFLCWCDRTTANIRLDIFSEDPDETKNVSELITSKGYPVEEHIVQTADGYLLSVQRIPHGKTRSFSRNQNNVVLLIHGLLGDAGNWVINFPYQSLGFLLPDAGYDTWLMSTRGCTYSKRHVVYTTHQQQFWNFSFDQLAQYDVPTTIDYILDATGEKDLYIIGHSQGTTATFAMLSDQPLYNDKVKLFIALAPVATTGHITSSSRLLVPFAYEIATRAGVYFANFPSGTSTKSALHYAQLVKSKKFRKFDYQDHNLEYYHKEEPPEYDLSFITTPVALFWSSNDKLADPEDVDILRRQLNSLVFDYKIPYPYEHFDFVLAINADKLVNEPILQLLRQY